MNRPSLYSVSAKVKVNNPLTEGEKLMNIWYGGITNHDFSGNLSFMEKPSEEDIIDLLRLLRPEKKYYLGSVRIEYLRELNDNEL